MNDARKTPLVIALVVVVVLFLTFVGWAMTGMGGGMMGQGGIGGYRMGHGPPKRGSTEGAVGRSCWLQ